MGEPETETPTGEQTSADVPVLDRLVALEAIGARMVGFLDRLEPLLKKLLDSPLAKRWLR